MNLSGLSNSQIEQAIEKMQKGVEIKPNSPEAAELQTSIDRALEELQRRAQKKSVELTANQGQLPDMEQRLKQENKAAFFEERQEKAKEAKQEFESTMQKSGLLRPESNPVENKVFRESVMNAETRVIGTIEDPTPAPIPVVAIGFKTKEGKTEIRRLTQTDILTLLKTYFKRVATSAKMESKRYSEAYDSDMGKTVYKLFQGWNMIYNETEEGTAWPPLTDVFPGLARASQQQKVNAEILWRWASNDKQ